MHNSSGNTKTSLLIVAGILLLGLAIYLLSQNTNTEPQNTPQATPQNTVSALFTCDEGKSIQATFYPDEDTHVDLVLSDGRTLSVPHAISASGARYANQDEGFVFWNKGNTAFVTENDAMTYKNCVTE